MGLAISRVISRVIRRDGYDYEAADPLELRHLGMSDLEGTPNVQSSTPALGEHLGMSDLEGTPNVHGSEQHPGFRRPRQLALEGPGRQDFRCCPTSASDAPSYIPASMERPTPRAIRGHSPRAIRGPSRDGPSCDDIEHNERGGVAALVGVGSGGVW